MNYLFDTKDLHILGFNQCLLDNYPTRFREATEAEVGAHFTMIGKPRNAPDPVEARKEERRLMAEADAKEKVREEAEYRAGLQAPVESAEVDEFIKVIVGKSKDAAYRDMCAARAKKAGLASKAKRDAARAAK